MVEIEAFIQFLNLLEILINGRHVCQHSSNGGADTFIFIVMILTYQ